jgi:hypothetical protein
MPLITYKIGRPIEPRSAAVPKGRSSTAEKRPCGTAAKLALLLLLSLLITAPARAAWFDAAWSCRRTVDVAWDTDKFVGNETAQAEVYTDGRALPNGADVRVATEDGKPVPYRLLSVGPGDRVRVAFAMAQGVKRYAVYFGNPAPPPPPPEMEVRSGLLMETRVFNGGATHTFDQIRRAFDRGGPVLGQTLVDNAFLGFNPFDDHVQIVSRLTGAITAPTDGDYQFAMAVDDEGALYIDDQPTVLAHLGPGDTRYHATVHLAPGPHAFVLYHVNLSAGMYFSVGWQRPEARRVAVIGKQAFGNLYADGNITVGPLEVRGKTLVADFTADRVAECPVSEVDDAPLAFHYRFTALAKIGVPVHCTWDLGDGQTAAGPVVDHVYLRDGVYAVRCVAHAGPNSDAETCRVVVGRDYLHLSTAKTEPPVTLSPIVAGYDLSAVPAADLPRAVRLHMSAGRMDPALAAATALASKPSQPEEGAAGAALAAVEQALLAVNRPEPAIALWERVPASVGFHPVAARHAADLALWWTGDAGKAVALLAPHHDDPFARVAYAQALVLTGHVDDARSILASVHAKADGARRAALSGADARSVEFYITEDEPDAGDAAWRRWMTDFPTDYLAGYSVLLRTKLMQLRHRDGPAAAIAEAFANAVPSSSYAPQLLDRAAKLLAKSDPAKSAALRQQLKQKYPEDPLSQD